MNNFEGFTIEDFDERLREIRENISEARRRLDFEIRPREPRPLDLSNEISHPAPMTNMEIKQAIEARHVRNQDVIFFEKKECSVCLASWKEILLAEKNLVFTACGHVFCRECAIKLASEGRRECALCKRTLDGVTPPFRRLHLPLDPRLKKKSAH